MCFSVWLHTGTFSIVFFFPMNKNKIQKGNLLASSIIILRILDFCQESHQTTIATTKANIKF